MNPAARPIDRRTPALLRWLAPLALLLPLGGAIASDFSMLIARDPSDDSGGPVSSTSTTAAALGKLLNAPARIAVSHDLKDCLRASRTSENQVILAPAHVLASALSHGYLLAAVSNGNTQYVLVARKGMSQASDLREARLYLPQQDSLRSYVARGLVEQAGLSMKTLKKVEYRNTSGAGLIAIGLGMADATVAEQGEAQAWIHANPGKAAIVSTSQPFPSALSMAIHKSVPAADRERLTQWAVDPASPLRALAALRPASASSEQAYGYVASLGIVTPDKLPGATLVSAEQVRDLIAKRSSNGVVIVDTRSAREFNAERIEGAVLAPYVEKSLKDRDYDAALDDLGAIAKLDRSRPTVFLCNGPECWKSYKASREAIKLGFKSVYWFRGGMPEWRARGLPTLRSESLAAAEKR